MNIPDEVLDAARWVHRSDRYANTHAETMAEWILDLDSQPDVPTDDDIVVILPGKNQRMVTLVEQPAAPDEDVRETLIAALAYYTVDDVGLPNRNNVAEVGRALAWLNSIEQGDQDGE